MRIDIDYHEFLKWENILLFYRDIKKDGFITMEGSFNELSSYR